jgi:hypothetical protein
LAENRKRKKERNSPKLNVFCAMFKEKVYRSFFFAESTVTGTSYLDMTLEWLMTQLDDDRDDFIYQQHGAPAHYHHLILNQHLPQPWIGRMAANDQALPRWPPRSPDLTPYNFFLSGCVRDWVFLQPLPRDLPELRR